MLNRKLSRQPLMTEGKPLKAIILLALPLVTGFIMTAVGNAVDTALLGKVIGDTALSAAGACASPIALISVMLAGMTASVRIHLSRCIGAEDVASVRKYTLNGIIVSTVVSLLVSAVAILLIRTILTFMNTPESIFETAVYYSAVSIAVLVPTYIYDSFLSILKAAGKGNMLMTFTGIGVVFRIIYDLLFVVILKMQLTGLLAASLLTSITGGVICFLYINRFTDFFRFREGNAAFDIKTCVTVFKTGLPLGLQSAIMTIGSILLQTGINKYLGTDYTSANTAAGQLITWMLNPILMFGAALSVYCGQNLGAKKYARIADGIRVSLITTFIYGVICAVILHFASQSVAAAFTDRPELLPLAKQISTVQGLFYPFAAILVMLRESLQGLGHGVLTLYGGLAEGISFAVAGLVFIPAFGSFGAMLANPLAWTLTAVLFTVFALIVYKPYIAAAKEERLALKNRG